MRVLKIGAALCAGLVTVFLSVAASNPDASAAPTPVMASQATVKDLAWLTGAWAGEGFGGTTDETWSAPAGGTLVGTFRVVQEGKTAMSLFFLVEEEESGLFLRFKHFGPGYEAWEETANVFRLEKLEGQTAVFRCPNEEQELRSVSYRMSDAKELVVQVESRGEDKALTQFELVFHRKEVN